MKIFFHIIYIFALSSCVGTGNKDILMNKGDGVIYSSKFDLYWQQDPSRLFSTAEDAQNYVEDLHIGGYKDWRIPTKEESYNLFFSLDFGKSTSREMGMITNGSFWTVQKNGSLKAGTWDTGQTCCIIRSFQPDKRGKVRAVRP